MLVDKISRYRRHALYAAFAYVVLWTLWNNYATSSDDSLHLSSSSSAESLEEEKINKTIAKKDIFGRKKFVVLSCLFEVYKSPSQCLFDSVCGCAYWLPISILAWRRMGFKAIVIVAGSVDGEKSWKQRGSFNYVLSLVRKFKGVHIQEIVVSTDEKYYNASAKIARLFAANFIEVVEDDDDPYVVLAEPNTFPLSNSYFEPSNENYLKGITIIPTKTPCCRRFLLSGFVVKLLPPDTSVGMLASTWKAVFRNFSLAENASHDGDQVDNTNSEVRNLYDTVIGEKRLNQLRSAPKDNLILSILINRWLRSKGALSPKAEKEIVEMKKLVKNKDELKNPFKVFPLIAHVMSVWSDIFPLASELFDSQWLDLTDYWMHFTNVVNSEKILRFEHFQHDSSLMINGVRFLPLALPAPPKQKVNDTEDTEIIGSYGDKQEDFQYVAFFDQNE